MNTSLDLGNSLLVMLIGVAIVFFGLTVLILLITLLVKATQNIGKEKAAAPAPKPAPAEAAPAAAEEPEADEGELIAAITAALAVMMGTSANGFVVRHVKRVHNAPAFSRAGREAQMNARF